MLQSHVVALCFKNKTNQISPQCKLSEDFVYLHSHICGIYMRKCDYEMLMLKFWWIYAFSSLTHTSDQFSWMLSVWMFPLLAFEWFIGSYSYLVFRSLSIIGQWPVNMNILVKKIGTLPVCPNTKGAIFSEMAYKILFTLH
jgi:hypothetical protein